MPKRRIAVYGAGGFGREVAWLADECNRPEEQYEFVGFIDDDPAQARMVNGSSVFTLAHVARRFPGVRVVIAVGGPGAREKLAKRVLEAGFDFETLVHPSVVRSQYIELGIGSIICAGCVLTTNIVFGHHVQVNLNSTIGHDVAIGNCSTLGPGVHIAGFVNIGKRVFIGAGAVIVNGTRTEPLNIGNDTVIGAGSCVIRSLPAGSHVFGNPARPFPYEYSKRPDS